MKKSLVLSLSTIALLSTSLNAESMYDRFEAMELKMKQMEKELKTLKAEKAAQKELSSQVKDEDDEDEEQDAVKSDDEDEEEGKVSEDDDTDEEADTSDNSEDEEADDEEDDEESVEDQLAEIQETLSDLTKGTSGNHLKFNVDYRFALDNLNYKMASGETKKNNSFMTNRFWLNMNWSATENLSFHGQLAYNKAFGARSIGNSSANMENFDWIVNENAYDGTLRVRSVYFLYVADELAGLATPWTFSIGRRPSTNGHIVNLRDDDHASSPMGHTINVEFDGLSAKLGLDEVTGIDGMYVKLCAGRGLTNADTKMSSPTPYANNTNALPDIDLAGFIFVPYDNGQYSFNTQYYYANNLIDSNTSYNGFDTVGGMHSFTANFIANGIGDDWSEYLEDTIFFVSWAMTKTKPKDRGTQTGMLGSNKAETGSSLWIGAQMPSIISEDGKWGLEYNHGSRYWRSITYAEDTNIGSKLATRGDAYEIYFTEPIVEDILSLQLRYTYIDYKYTGSNGFFGNTTGNSMLIDDIPTSSAMASQIVDKAQDIRFYIRYRY